MFDITISCALNQKAFYYSLIVVTLTKSIGGQQEEEEEEEEVAIGVLQLHNLLTSSSFYTLRF